MLTRLKALLGRLGWTEKLFLAVLVVYLAGRFAFPGTSFQLLLAVALFFLGAAVVYRLARLGMKKLIWRLRNRLLVVYLFIAVVPVVLILVLAGIGAWILTGQIATYLVVTELDRRTTSLLGPARGHVRWLPPHYRQRFPGLELISRSGQVWRDPPEASITPPPEGWQEASGLVLKGGALYLWAHAASRGAQTTIVAPMAPNSFSEMVPGLAEVTMLLEEEPAAGAAAAGKPRGVRYTFMVSGRRFRMPAAPQGGKEVLPPPANRFDREVTYLCPVSLAIWEAPGRTEKRLLIIRTRYSAVLRALFGQTVEFSPGFTMAALASFAFTAVAILFLIVEGVSLVIGVRLTRSITGAVHNLYEGTERVREGDFSHRIEVRGNDQLSELGHSFNRMTENLERLVEVAKEKERLQGELEIAREVQNQLLPKSVPVSKTLKLTAACRPARMVSGDYYDYLNLEEPRLALAIGDVAGKGISAALLMATVQSSMRAQLRAGCELAQAGGAPSDLSPAALVSRLNQQLHAYTSPEKFSTFYFALYDDSTGVMTYTNAGHLPPMLVRGGEVSRLEVTGTIIGAFPFSRYEESILPLAPGDLLVCFTDGITEPENEYGEMFGEERLIELILRHARGEGEELIEAVMDAVCHWTASPELYDDMTMLVARRI
jgi:sigma-B regulation protein RsbU (phosphoserine phosphatase)